MQWILQDFEDTRRLGDTLSQYGLPHSWHKVVPFVGKLDPEPVIADPHNVILFGSYGLRHYAGRHGLRPGVFTIAPFLDQQVWHPHLLNGPEATVLRLSEIPAAVTPSDRAVFLRPVEDSKEVAGMVRSAAEIVEMAQKVLALPPEDLPGGSLQHDTLMMLSAPARIQKEWRVWIVGGTPVTWSLYREGRRVTYRAEIDDDALTFAHDMARANPAYCPAYVMDICRTEDGLRLLETNCLNAAGFYAADISRLVQALEDLSPPSAGT